VITERFLNRAARLRAFGLVPAHAELDAILCSGPRRGKQFTYALLDERARRSGSAPLTREAALGELTLRYSRSDGAMAPWPRASARFRLVVRLTITDAKRGVERAGEALRSELVEDEPSSSQGGWRRSVEKVQPWSRSPGSCPSTRRRHARSKPLRRATRRPRTSRAHHETRGLALSPKADDRCCGRNRASPAFRWYGD
jgi:hypothetical protein